MYAGTRLPRNCIGKRNAQVLDSRTLPREWRESPLLFAIPCEYVLLFHSPTRQAFVVPVGLETFVDFPDVGPGKVHADGWHEVRESILGLFLLVFENVKQVELKLPAVCGIVAARVALPPRWPEVCEWLSPLVVLVWR